MAILASLHRLSDFGTLVNNYRLTTSTSAVYEGSSVTYTFYTIGVPDGTTFYYSISGTNITEADFTDGLLTGSFNVTSDVGTITKTLSLDGSAEVEESFVLSVRFDSTSGEVIKSSSEVFVTSGTVLVYADSANMNESATLGFSVSTTNTTVSTLYWEIVNLTTTNSDFTAATGTVSITSGAGTFNVTTSTDYSTEGSETFRVDIRSGSSSGPVVASSSTVTIADTSLTPMNQVAYTTTGTFSWTAPTGVTSVCVLCVGGGGGGGADMSTVPIGSSFGGSAGGGGGGVGYKNNITVVPGQNYTVVVGIGGARQTYGGARTTAGDSYFIDTSTVKGGAGQSALYNSRGTGGTYTGDGGGNGGDGGYGESFAYPVAGGGGGAGGYSGNGGKGSWSTTGGTGSGSAGSGGGAGGGAPAYYSTAPLVNSQITGTAYGGYGGGVGLLGEGSNGAAAVYAGSAQIGPDGGAGSGGTGSSYGGGAGANRIGNQGAVRIIWGTGRSYPSTHTIDSVPLVVTTAITYKAVPVSSTITTFTPVTYTGGTGTVTLSISPGLPSGLTFNTSTGAISGTTTSTVTSDTVYTVDVVDSFDVSGSGSFTLAVEVTGQALYATNTGSSTTWTCPEGVTSVSVVCIGGGGSGSTTTGGGGGGLGYKNNITVVPGQNYTVVQAAYAQQGFNGNDSYFISLATVSGGGGLSGGAGGSYTGDGGGAGGSGSAGTTNKGGGGGGAGGYSGSGGAGGAGGTNWSIQPPTNGSGGGGAGGYGAASTGNTYQGGGGGGGVGNQGQGSNGTIGAAARAGGASGSGGPVAGSTGATSTVSTGANGGTGGTYGGGGGGKGTAGSVGGTGSYGAVRIIWPGTTRQFPSTRTADET
jgi:hypothetical protein